jgi:hypothetical protein
MDTIKAIRKPLVVFHDHCLDGYASAWCFYHHDPDGFEFHGGRYQDKEFDKQLANGLFDDRLIYLVDFSYPLERMKQLLALKSSGQIVKLIVLDHHKTALAMFIELRDYINLNIDHCTPEQSGCSICWNYLNPGKPLPRILQHIQDRDLWQFKLDHTREICIVLQSVPDMTYKRMNDFIFESDFNSMVTIGSGLMMAQANRIKFALYRTDLGVDEDGNIYACVNCTSDISELGNEMCKLVSNEGKRPAYSDIWYVNKDEVKHSLRSIGDFDVSAICKRYGGGGHKNASGYSVPTEVFNQYTIIDK